MLALAATLTLSLAAQPTTEPPSRISRTLVVMNNSAATATLIDPDSGVIRGTIGVGEGPHEVAVSPDGRVAVVTNYGGRLPGSTLTVINILARRKVRDIKLREPGDAPRRTLHRPHGVRFLADGKRVVVTAEQERRLVIVDVERGEVDAAIDTRASTSHMVACDAKRAYVANIDSGSVSAIDLEQGKLIGVVRTGAGAEGIALHGERGEVWVTNRGDDTITVLDADTLAVRATIACGKFPVRVAFTPDGVHALVSNAHSGNVAVIDVARRAIQHRITMNAKATDTEHERVLEFGESPVPGGLLVQPDGNFAYIAHTHANFVTVLDLRAWSIARRLRSGPRPDGMAWSEIRLDK